MDLDGDGCDDLIGSGYCGTTLFFKGRKDGTFVKGEFLKDDKGNPVNDGRYSEGIKKGTHYTKDNKVAEHTLAVKAVDWDNDGDYDLVLNTSYGIKLSINKGSKTKHVFSSEFSLLPLHPSHFAFDFVDWDNDGLWDIICGGKTGGIHIYKNSGEIGKPKFEKSSVLYSDEQIIENPIDLSANQLCVCDYNNDGKKDLLVCNRSTQYKWKDNVSHTDKKKVRKIMVEMKSYLNRVKDAYNRVYHSMNGKPYNKIKEAMDKDEEYAKYSKLYSDLNSKTTSYIEPKRKTGSYIYVVPGR